MCISQGRLGRRWRLHKDVQCTFLLPDLFSKVEVVVRDPGGGVKRSGQQQWGALTTLGLRFTRPPAEMYIGQLFRVVEIMGGGGVCVCVLQYLPNAL